MVRILRFEEKTRTATKIIFQYIYLVISKASRDRCLLMLNINLSISKTKYDVALIYPRKDFSVLTYRYLLHSLHGNAPY